MINDMSSMVDEELEFVVNGKTILKPFMIGLLKMAMLNSIPGFIEETVKEGIRKALSTIMESEGIGTSGNVVQPQAARMRTVQQVVAYFKEQNPNTNMNEYLLRTMIKTGKLAVVKAGHKSLINLDKLIGQLNGFGIQEQEEQQPKKDGYGKIRRVEL